jgi:hypothetical protein
MRISILHRRVLRAMAGFLLFLAFGTPAAAQTTGKIAGRVVDAAGEPLPGVNVYIEGTTQGNSTDADGEYFILNVRPGSYTLVASFIGFSTVRITDVPRTGGPHYARGCDPGRRDDPNGKRWWSWPTGA